MTDKQKKALSISAFIFFVLFMGFLCIYIGKPMIEFVKNPDEFRAWVDMHGIWGRLGFMGMVVLQIIVAIIPGEPLEIVAGYAFGALEGTILCLIGIFIGSILVFLFVKKLGIKLVEVFFSKEKIASLKFLQNTKRLNSVVFIIFFIPGTPKDLLSYFVGLTPMTLRQWIFIAPIARIPSVITSTIGGSALGEQKYLFAVIVFVIAAVISAIGLVIYNKISRTAK